MIRINEQKLRASVEAEVAKVRRVRRAVDPGGFALVQPTGARNVDIAEQLVERGKEIYDLTTSEEDAIERTVSRFAQRGVAAGDRQAFRDALMEGARHLIEIVRRAIIHGRMGVNQEPYRSAKGKWQRKHGMTRYGAPSWYGIRTGEFINSLRAYWVQR